MGSIQFPGVYRCDSCPGVVCKVGPLGRGRESWVVVPVDAPTPAILLNALRKGDGREGLGDLGKGARLPAFLLSC